MNKKKSEKSHKNKTVSQNSASLPKRSKVESQREATLERLRESEERFRLLSEAAEEGIAIHDNGVIIEANQALSRMFGYELSEIIGKYVKNGATPESWKAVQEHIDTGYDKPYEIAGVRKDGSTFVCSMVGKPYKYKDRMLRVATFRDITELKRVEEKLRFEEQRFRTFVEHSSDIIALLNLEGIITYINPVVERVLGFKPEERIGAKGFELVHPDDIKFLADSFNTLAKDTNFPVIRGEMHLRHKDGSWRTFEAVGSNLVNNNVVEAVIVNYRDITKREQAEEKLRHEEERFRALAEQSSDIIIFVNREGIVTYENPAVERSLGLKTEKRIGVSIFERIHPDDLKFASDAFNTFAVSASSKDINAPVRQIRLRHKDGSWRTFETAASKLLHDNIVEAIIINLRDITERKKAEELLKESEAKYRLLADHMKDQVWIMDLDLKVTYISPSVEKLLGYTLDELKQLPLDKLLTSASLREQWLSFPWRCLKP